MSKMRTLERIFLRCLIVGAVYSAANSLAAVLLGPLSRLAPTGETIAVWTLTGTLICLSFSYLILRSSWPRWRTVLAVWASLALIRSIGLGIEGALFKPAGAAASLSGAAAGIVVAFLTAWLAVWLLARPAGLEGGAPKAERAWWSWLWRVVVVGLAYFFFYFVFGAANAFLYTMSFYRDNPQYGLSMPPASAVFAAQLIRGPLFALGSLFIARAARASRARLALWLGILLFVIGGFAPYVEVTFRTMPLGFNLATLAEILLQNFLTGVVAAYLFGAKVSKEQAS
jgi:hypothetical protein